MSTRTAFLLILILILGATLSGLILWERLPQQMASHWNAANEVDGYTSRFWGVFLMPLISLGLAVLFFVIPQIDPLRENIQHFRRIFNGFIVSIIAFLLYLHILSLVYNLGIRFPMSRLLLPAMAVLIFLTGELLRRAKRNWFIGIRTPWTLSDERVWAETHRLGSVLFKAAAGLILLSVFLPGSAFEVVLGAVLLAAFVPLGYSYWLYERYRRQDLAVQGKEENR